jgi:hypothetical protein
VVAGGEGRVGGLEYRDDLFGSPSDQAALRVLEAEPALAVAEEREAQGQRRRRLGEARGLPDPRR